MKTRTDTSAYLGLGTAALPVGNKKGNYGLWFQQHASSCGPTGGQDADRNTLTGTRAESQGGLSWPLPETLTFTDTASKEVKLLFCARRLLGTEPNFAPPVFSCSGLSVVQLVPVESLLSHLWSGPADLGQNGPAAQPVRGGPL